MHDMHQMSVHVVAGNKLYVGHAAVERASWTLFRFASTSTLPRGFPFTIHDADFARPCPRAQSPLCLYHAPSPSSLTEQIPQASRYNVVRGFDTDTHVQRLQCSNASERRRARHPSPSGRGLISLPLLRRRCSCHAWALYTQTISRLFPACQSPGDDHFNSDHCRTHLVLLHRRKLRGSRRRRGC